ncbi:hypothetical protein C4D60_Mb04t33310 [Musa balbisiana]|uniref:Uncharacterized protein n=1 Tax=Musa balbisiana TaxID=52838 RepID=A0A4S8KGF5_MUSBA|nr:hypothetical protein C4D60_Mb04t33310 [Musa balbisiana]
MRVVFLQQQLRRWHPWLQLQHHLWHPWLVPVQVVVEASCVVGEYASASPIAGASWKDQWASQKRSPAPLAEEEPLLPHLVRFRKDRPVRGEDLAVLLRPIGLYLGLWHRERGRRGREAIPLRRIRHAPAAPVVVDDGGIHGVEPVLSSTAAGHVAGEPGGGGGEIIVDWILGVLVGGEGGVSLVALGGEAGVVAEVPVVEGTGGGGSRPHRLLLLDVVAEGIELQRHIFGFFLSPPLRRGETEAAWERVGEKEGNREGIGGEEEERKKRGARRGRKEKEKRKKREEEKGEMGERGKRSRRWEEVKGVERKKKKRERERERGYRKETKKEKGRKNRIKK